MSEIKNNYLNFLDLRKKYQTFTYESFSINKTNNNIEIEYNFNISGKFYFRPTIVIPKNNYFINEDKDLQNIVFNIGLIELISYWKAACCPEVIIKPAMLNQKQIEWWKKVYFNGLGEFFFLNGLIGKKEINHIDFMNITCESKNVFYPVNLKPDDSYIIPVGGGKDSVVTLELLKNTHKDNVCLIVNPRGASTNCAKIAGFEKNRIININRKIDDELLELNNKGFLNGHTPFSALLGFVSVMVSIITGKKNIALSNESSANESTVADSFVNHQYSKSFEFEFEFRNYIKEFICNDINYFSMLRPLSELQIGYLFSQNSKYFKAFKSCNAGSKKDLWCCKCSKCLFTFIMLSLFMTEEEITKIFGSNLLNDKNLLIYFDQLIGNSKEKPFECVGTTDEVNIALTLTINKWKNKLPLLLEYYKSLPNYNIFKSTDLQKFLNHFDSEHFLTIEQLNLINNAIHL
ncbi:MAG: hypothetical protein Q8880_07560 [Bacteroidota bacterium]|nr:hypothetical protein [Bacteroidota bacterium]